MVEKRTFVNLFHASPTRLRKVRQDIAEGSEPGLRFYIMVVVSTMIAGFGLVTNSTAVIIGAMLVAPLMTPIFGISLALIRNDAKLLGHAVQAEVVGVVAAVFMGFVLGTVYPGLEPTPEMLSRTNPQLFDLLVAVFSGFAGAYALVDEKISPALPGVAIATAIVPPLANTGLCFSVGPYSGGIGSFLLFFSNFLSILLVGAIVFWAFKLAGDYDRLDTKTVFKRFGFAIIGFFFIAALLSQSLYRIWVDQARKETIRTVLTREFKKFPSFYLDKSIYDEEKDRIYVVADIQTGRLISPRQVGYLQEKLEEELAKKTELTIRSSQVQTVNALGSRMQVEDVDLDGDFVSDTPDRLVLQTKQADTAIRNYLVDIPGALLKFIHVFRDADRNRLFVVASINSLFVPETEEIRKVERLLREELAEPNLDLFIRFQKSALYSRKGLYHIDLTAFTDLKPERESLLTSVETFVSERFEEMPATSLSAFNHAIVGDQVHCLIELSSIKVFSVEDVEELEKEIKELTGETVHLHVLSRPEVLASADGYEPYEEFIKRVYKAMRPEMKAEMERIFVESAF